jgi:hypothetical protein
MNERIKQLAIEAKLIASEPNGFDQNNLSKAQQKFAELIVKECADVAYGAYWHDPEGVRGIHITDAILENFGVEE